VKASGMETIVIFVAHRQLTSKILKGERIKKVMLGDETELK
jgi:hypothetical protein